MIERTNPPTSRGHIAVIARRMTDLKVAIELRDWDRVEWEYDRVLRAQSKLTAFLNPAS